MVERFDLLVIGGGVAGMKAALDSARSGLKVALVEKEMELGGLSRTFTHMVVRGRSPSERVRHLIEEVGNENGIKVMLGHHVGSVSREGDLVTVIVADSIDLMLELEVRGVLLATGMEPVDVSAIPEYGAGRLKGVMTSLEFDPLLSKWEVEGRPAVSSVAFVQCVGSRVEKRGVPYCSNYCCMNSVKESIRLKTLDPKVQVHVFYIDVRTCGRGQEAAYKEARRRGVRFVRGQPALVREKDGKLLVCGENTLLNELYEVPADTVVLNVGIRLSQETLRLAGLLGMSLDDEGLLFVDDLAEGTAPVLTVGCAESPMDVESCLEQASNVANSMVRFLGHQGQVSTR
ncbi:MAG TPA: FAD-dependent oxidoreductase [Methanomassiliicoccales archaeon]|jgi:heterodisulfide reductase subunit A-like polyferredoxin